MKKTLFILLASCSIPNISKAYTSQEMYWEKLERLQHIVAHSPTFGKCTIETSKANLEFGDEFFGRSMPTLKLTIAKADSDPKKEARKIEVLVTGLDFEYDIEYKDSAAIVNGETLVVKSDSGYLGFPYVINIRHDGKGNIKNISFLKPNSYMNGKGPSYENGYLDCKEKN